MSKCGKFLLIQLLVVLSCIIVALSFQPFHTQLSGSSTTLYVRTFGNGPMGSGGGKKYGLSSNIQRRPVGPSTSFTPSSPSYSSTPAPSGGSSFGNGPMGGRPSGVAPARPSGVAPARTSGVAPSGVAPPRPSGVAPSAPASFGNGPMGRGGPPAGKRYGLSANVRRPVGAGRPASSYAPPTPSYSSTPAPSAPSGGSSFGNGPMGGRPSGVAPARPSGVAPARTSGVAPSGVAPPRPSGVAPSRPSGVAPSRSSAPASFGNGPMGRGGGAGAKKSYGLSSNVRRYP